jgi:hypothetical protein
MGVSTALIKSIRQQSKDRGEKGTLSLLHMPGKHQPRPADRNVTIDACDMSVIRWTVQEFYITHHKIPSCHKLLPVIKQKIGLAWGVHSLWNIYIS